MPAFDSALNNHLIILLLTNNAIQTVTDVPVFLAYYHTGIIWSTHCSILCYSVFH